MLYLKPDFVQDYIFDLSVDISHFFIFSDFNLTLFRPPTPDNLPVLSLLSSHHCTSFRLNMKHRLLHVLHDFLITRVPHHTRLHQHVPFLAFHIKMRHNF